ncbi:hypothetical protein [Cryobacterium tagatosivorans]|uniref:Uncharacterized protein n=1 Tax=Cryobacterium tagatosivorans TaxID=1259199 RepID=A0A4R8UK40_9MICO|nr:hypothetical protein [Cryobacterium tagatosivorans]TFB56349.1 hypothetical protein E3O23_01025 [Cryobacterium tagatosivorans]
MNQYGLLARDHWIKVAPSRYAALPNPGEYFEGLGEQVQSQVDNLSQRIAGSDLAGETYLEKVGRLTMAKRQAEEIVLADLVWITPELSADEAREEWGSVQPPVEALADWAFLMQDEDREFKSVDPIEQLAEDWMLPESFLEVLAVQDNPYRFLSEQAEILTESANQRYRRFRETQGQEE